MLRSESDLIQCLAPIVTRPHDKEASAIRSRLDSIMVRIDDSNDAITRLSREFFDAARDPLNQVLPAITQLGEVLVQVSKADETKHRILIAKAKVLASSISTILQTLIGLGKAAIRSGDLMKERNEGLEDITSQAAQRITELTQIADGWLKSAVDLKAIRQAATCKPRKEVDGAWNGSRKPNGERIPSG